MSSKRSDSLSGTAADVASGAAGVLSYAPEGPPTHAWWFTLRANWSIPFALLAVVLLGRFVVETRWFGPYNQRVVMLIGFNIILAVSLQLINGFSGQFSLGHAGFMAVGAYMAAYPAKEFSQRLTDPAASLWFFVVLGTLVAIVGGVLLLLFTGLRASRKLHNAFPAALMLVLFGWILTDLARSANYERVPPYFLWTHAIAAVRGAFGWMLSHGLPVAARISSALPESVRAPLTFVVLIIGAGACAAVVGLVVGLPALRLRGDYLAIATLGMAEIIRILIQNSPALGQALGITNIPKYTDFAWLYGSALVTIIVIWRVAYSSKGRAIMAVREDEIAASACGIDTTHYKVMAFVIGAFFGGVAGALFAMHERSITPSFFSMAKSIEIVVMVTLGGLGSITGAILAAIVLTLLPEVLRPINQYRMIIYSLLLIVMMLLRPQGLLGGRELWPRRNARGRRRRDPVATEDRDDVGAFQRFGT
jgi:ABC-type branched-subunit amino acid transport system permease subunit